MNLLKLFKKIVTWYDLEPQLNKILIEDIFIIYPFFFNMKITQCIAYSNLNTDNAWIEHFVVIYESELFNEIPLKVKFLYN